jgi:heme-degrading monooxygenase HmoA
VIAVVSILDIYPNRQEAWQQVWQQVYAAHRAAEGFYTARLFHDADRSERFVILSEWDDRAHYNQFVRHVGVPWLVDAFEYSPGPATVMVVQEQLP